MALASGFFPRPSYTPGASQCAPFFLGFGFDGECCDPSFAAYYDYEEYAPSGQSPLTSSKDYTSSSPLQSPEPDYTPSSPDYAPASPAYTPASPSPSLEYTSSSPVRLVFMMPSPPRGASPDYTPLTPSEHAASSPYYTPSSPPGPGRASWPDYTPSTPPPSPLAVSDAESVWHLPEFGAYALGKLLWSSYVRFQLSPRGNKLKFNSGYVIVIRLYLKGLSTVSPLLCRSLREEAAELVGYTGMDGINPTIVLNCFLYSLFLTEKQRGKPISVDYAWDTHACNYWICDGILQGDKAYEVGSALHAVMQMLCYPSDRIKVLVDYFGQHGEQYERWVSISSNQSRDQNISIVPVNASSYFLTVAGDNQLQLPNDMFQLAMNLHVLKLHKCSFDFASPPFRFRHNLRFLWLDHCTNSRGDQGGWQCFPNLLVLDIRFTDFVLLIEMTELMTNLREVNTKGISWRNLSHAWKKLYNLHKLRVTESLDVITVETCSFVDMINLELLDLSGNIHMKSLPAVSSSGNLKMLVLDGCSRLKHVALEGATPQLGSFSFDGYGSSVKWTHDVQLPTTELRPKSRNASLPKAKFEELDLRESWIRGSSDSRTISFGRTVGL
uniref:Uncharacterized protein n=1 Tax=Aegilops tauschii TaxID=37682 RepID=M8C8D7_AEGTA